MEKKKPKWAMLIDASKCVGCYACRIACQNQNELKIKEYYNRIHEQESGKFPNFTRRFLPVQCQHCDNPPCVRVCPTGASYKRKDGVVIVDKKRCIGCKFCILSCPYKARIINEEKGYIHKCSFCIEFVEQGKTPACVTTCMMGVRVFGDLNNPESEISRLIIKKKPGKLGADLNTKPSIFYIMR
jgi:DMSO reductase iron-sulfur subunit